MKELSHMAQLMKHLVVGWGRGLSSLNPDPMGLRNTSCPDHVRLSGTQTVFARREQFERFRALTFLLCSFLR